VIARRAALAGMAASALARPAIGQSGLGALGELARRAAIYAMPIQELYRRRWRETVDPANPALLQLNRLDHATAPSVVAPDALLSSGWVELTTEPMFLTLPDMGARSYSFAVIDMFGDTIDHVSRRHYGGRSPPHVLFGPTWANPPPWGVRAIQATSNFVRLAGRIGVDGPDDLAAALATQAKVLFETPTARNERRVLESRELMPAGTVIPDEPVASWPEPRDNDPWDLFVVAARVLGESPVPARDAAEVETFAALKLRPGRRFDLLGFSPAERDAMRAGIDAARAEIGEATARAIRRVGAWRYPPAHPGDFADDRVGRAVVAMRDPLMPAATESMTLFADTDDSGAALQGSRRYALRFSADGPPPTRAGWSLSVQGVAVGGLRRDGGEPIDIPAGQPGDITIALHIVEPTGPLLDDAWRPPSVVAVD
jgi:hypothetical protein